MWPVSTLRLIMKLHYSEDLGSFSDHYLTVQHWNPNFDAETAKDTKIPVWIRIPKIPMHCFDKDFLADIGNRFGKTLRIDETTYMAARGRFGRVSVEIDLTKPLKSKFRFRRHIHTIEYEGLHSACFHCGKFGHRIDLCLNIPKDEEPQNNESHRQQSDAMALKNLNHPLKNSGLNYLTILVLGC